MIAVLILLVGARGFEPPTSRSQTERTTRLCYAPKHFSIMEKGRAHSMKRFYLRSSLVQIKGLASGASFPLQARGDLFFA